MTPYPTSDNWECIERRVFLAAGDYERKLFYQNTGIEEDREAFKGLFYFGAGWYTWQECLFGTAYEEYIHLQTLDPDNPQWSTSVWSVKWLLYEDPCYCTYQWGGVLRLLH